MDFLVVVIPIPFDKVDGVSAFDVVEAHKVSDSMWLQKKKNSSPPMDSMATRCQILVSTR